ncbi:MAG TPA: hypothetical protein VHU92_19185 [Streptosporangiaceae bacterium]|nr:hypothetical protein [Streptosporangiaceae bacterium]
MDRANHHAATAGFAGLAEDQPGLALLAYPGASQAVLVPAGVLLVAGLGGLLVAAGRRPLPPARPGAEAS